MPQAHYRHTQVGWMMIVVLGVTAIGIGLVLWLARVGGLLVFLELFFLVLAALFATLRVEIDERELRFSFGVGLIRKRTALADIRQFASVENPWWYGWGIHLTPAGALYNVSGRSAVQLSLDSKSLKTVRLWPPLPTVGAAEGPVMPHSRTVVPSIRLRADRLIAHTHFM